MTVKQLVEADDFQVINCGTSLSQKISGPFCCDLLSIAMSKMPASSVWITVMGNTNTLAVAALTEAACVILAEGMQLDEPAQEKARSQGITVLATKLSIFEASLLVYRRMHEKD